MKRKKMLVLALAVMVLLASLSMASDGYAEDFNLGGRFGVGIQLNALNFGIGPSVEYWPTNNIGISASFGSLSDYTSYGIRGSYLFDNKFDLFGTPTRPYLGAGFSSVTGPKYSFETVTSESKGSGIEIYGGILQQASFLQQASKNIYVRTEFIYSTFDVTTTIDAPSVKREFDAGYGGFSLGFGVVYYF